MYLLFSILLMLGALCALYYTIRLIYLDGFSGGVEDNIPLIASITATIILPFFSYGFYQMYSESLPIHRVFGS